MKLLCLNLSRRTGGRSDEHTLGQIEPQVEHISPKDGRSNLDGTSNSSLTQGNAATPTPQPHPVLVLPGSKDGLEPGSRHDTVNDTRPRYLAPAEPSITGSSRRESSTVNRSLSEIAPAAVQEHREQVPSSGLQGVLNGYRESMQARYSSPTQVSKDDPNKDNYLSLRRLREVLTMEELRGFFKQFLWYKEKHLQRLHNDYSCVVATLIDIGWEDWARFDDLFFAYHKEKSKENRRDDSCLPFRSSEELNFLGHRPSQLAFFNCQFKYKHAVLSQDKDHSAEWFSDTRLPFTKMIAVRPYESDGNESSRPVYKTEIDKYGIKLRNIRHQLQDNTEPELVAMKVFRYRHEFDRETKAQEIIKKNYPNSEHIVLSLTHFHYRGEHYILYPWADGDLQSLCYGTFPGFAKIAQGRLRPGPILSQLQGLALGLKDLHERYELHHYDLKLENLFVFSLDADTDAENDNQAAGQYKIGDFGLAEQRKFLVDILAVPAYTAAERSSGIAPRNPGAYQAPEMRPHGSVNHKTDNWSLGCILAVFYAFVLGGPAKVIEFERVRWSGYDSDQFYKVVDGTTFEVKEEILPWLRNLQASNQELSSDWRNTFVTCIEKLLVVERKDRIDAGDAAKYLGTLFKQAQGHTQLWDYGEEHTYVSEESRSDPVKSPLQTSSGLEPGRNGLAGLKRVNIAQFVPNFPLARNISKPPTFTKLDVKGNVFNIELNSRWAAFVCPNEVKIYDLEKLVQKPRAWCSDHSLGIASPEHVSVPNPCLFKCSVDGSQFVSVKLADSFVALVTAPETNLNDRYLEVRDLQWSARRSAVVSDHIVHPKIDESYIDMLISAEGTLALIFQDHIKLLFQARSDNHTTGARRGLRKIEIKEPDAVFRSAKFSDDGLYLCTWYYTHTNNWRVWKIDSEGGNAVRQHWRYASNTARKDLRTIYQHSRLDLIISTHDSSNGSPWFYALDEDKQMWLVTPGGNEMIQPSGKYCTERRFGASLPGKAVFVLGEITNKSTVMVDIVSGIPGSGRQEQPQLQVVNDWSEWALASKSLVGNFVRLTDDERDIFVIAHLDGSLVKIPIA